MRSTEARVQDLLARLTSAGFSPHRFEEDERIALVMKVPKSLPAESWRELYELLAIADRWGLESRSGCLTAHAAITRTSTATEVPRGHGPSALGS